MATPESKVKEKVKKLLDSYTDIYWFMPVPMLYQARSVDFLVCYAGRFIAIETKAAGKKLSAYQKLTFAKIEAAGGLTFVVSTDVELEALKVTLDHLY
jgi:hypothetical protein